MRVLLHSLGRGMREGSATRNDGQKESAARKDRHKGKQWGPTDKERRGKVDRRGGQGEVGDKWKGV